MRLISVRPLQYCPIRFGSINHPAVQYAGNTDPFLVTLILSCVQIISMLLTCTLTDRFGRRPLTVYPYGVTVLSVLALGIVGCFDYTQSSLSSLLVRPLYFHPAPPSPLPLFPPSSNKNNQNKQIFFACLATFSTTGASAIGYAYAAEIPSQRLRAQTAGWSLALSNMLATMFSFCTPLMINQGVTKWGVKTGFL
jgi:MFS family permease